MQGGRTEVGVDGLLGLGPRRGDHPLLSAHAEPIHQLLALELLEVEEALLLGREALGLGERVSRRRREKGRGRARNEAKRVMNEPRCRARTRTRTALEREF